MKSSLRNFVWAGVALVGCSGLAWGDEPSKKPVEEPKTEATKPAAEAPKADAEKPAATEGVKAGDIPQLIKDLDANRFSQRQAASDKLFQAGKDAIPALAETAGQEGREASTRAIDILKRHFQGGEAGLKTAAKEALEKVAKSGNDAAARRAQEALKPPADNSQNIPGGGAIQLVPGGGGIQIGGGQIQIQVQGGIGGPGFQAKRISVKNANGVKEIEAVEGDRTVKINEDANSIKVEVTKKKDGKDTTEKFEAKNLEELKKNSPEGAKLYEEYAQGNGAIKINAIQLGPGGALPVPAIPGIQVIQGQAQLVPGFPGQPDKAQTERLDKIRKQLDEVKERVKKVGEGTKNTEDLQKAIQQLEEAQKALEEATK